MFGFLDKIPYTALIILTVLMLLAPFVPMPHFIEKLIMLKNGQLTRPLDIFDLFFHSFPLLLLIIKSIKDYAG